MSDVWDRLTSYVETDHLLRVERRLAHLEREREELCEALYSSLTYIRRVDDTFSSNHTGVKVYWPDDWDFERARSTWVKAIVDEVEDPT